MLVTIAGGTGRVGSGATHQLIDGGHTVRVLTRDAHEAERKLGNTDGLELLTVDFANPASLAAGFDASDAALIALATTPTQVDSEVALIDAAVAANVKHLVKISCEGVATDSENMILRIHRAIEAHLATVALPTTIIRPNTFIDAIVGIAANFIPSGAWGGNTADGRGAFVDVRDVAALAAAVIDEGPGAHAGRTYVASGPQALTMPDIAGLFSHALKQTVVFHQRDEDANRAFLLGLGLPEARVGVLQALDQLTRENLVATLSPDIDRILKRPALPAQACIEETAAGALAVA